MATKSFGTHDQPEQTERRDYAAELRKLVGTSFPLSLTLGRDGSLIGATYDTQWQEGGTEPVTDEAGNVTDYKENYEKKKLTADQVKQIDKYLAENVTLQS